MRTLKQIIVACVAAALVAAGAPSSHAAPPPAGAPACCVNVDGQLIRLPGIVVNVVDGDTIDVKVEVGVNLVGLDPKGMHQIASSGVIPLVIRLRLLADTAGRGCWAPESRTLDLAEKKRGVASKINLEKLSLGKECTIIVPAHGYELKDYMSLERVLAAVEVAGKSLGEAQIKAKHASSTKGGQPGR